MKKHMSAFLLTALMIGMLAACGESPTEKPEVTSTADETTVSVIEEDSLEARKKIDDGLGNPDLGGYVLRLVCDSGNVKYSYLEESTGDVVDDAVYNRNSKIEDRFNCEIEMVYSASYLNTNKFIQQQVQSGDDTIDLINMHVVGLGMIATNGYFMNWCDIPKIDFTKPWWSPSTREDLTYKDTCFIAVGDFALTSLSQAYCVYFNKNLAEDYKLENMYDVVNEGRFTFDYLVQISKGLYKDLNGDQIQNNDDQYGFVANTRSDQNAFVWAFENPVIKNTGDKLEIVFKTEKMVDIGQALVENFVHGEGMRADVNYVNDAGEVEYSFPRDMFSARKAVFATGLLEHAVSTFRDFEDEYGILPYPKWSEDQKAYRTMSDGGHAAMAIPVTVTETEKVGIITEALCAESYKTVVPAFYDIALKVKGARDAESVAMIDMIVDGRWFDIGYVYDAFKGMSFYAQRMVRTDNPNFESYYAANSASSIAHYDQVIAFFEENVK